MVSLIGGASRQEGSAQKDERRPVQAASADSVVAVAVPRNSKPGISGSHAGHISMPQHALATAPAAAVKASASQHASPNTSTPLPAHTPVARPTAAKDSSRGKAGRRQQCKQLPGTQAGQCLKAGSAAAQQWYAKVWHSLQPKVQDSKANAAVRGDVKRRVRAAIKQEHVLSEQLQQLADIILVDRMNQQELGKFMEDTLSGKDMDRYCAHGLQERYGFTMLNRSSVVIDKASEEVLLIYVTEQHLSKLLGIDVSCIHTEQQQLLAAMRSCHPPVTSRAGVEQLYVTGLRYAPCETIHAPLGTFVRKDSAQSEKDAATLMECLKQSATLISEAEAAVAPQAAAARLAAAQAIGLPHGPGGVHTTACPATAVGCSLAYVSPPHCDRPVLNIYETVLFSSQHMPADAGWSFSSIEGRVLVDLQAGACCLVMVPGHTVHGTPWVNNKEHVTHPGIGTVIINKETFYSEHLELVLPDLWELITDRPMYQGGIHPQDSLAKCAATDLRGEYKLAVDRECKALKVYLKSQPESKEISKVLHSILEGWQVIVVPGRGRKGGPLYLFIHKDLPGEAHKTMEAAYKRCRQVALGKGEDQYPVRSVLTHFVDSTGQLYLRVHWLGWPEPKPLAEVTDVDAELANWIVCKAAKVSDELELYADMKQWDMQGNLPVVPETEHQPDRAIKQAQQLYARFEAEAAKAAKRSKAGKAAAGEQEGKKAASAPATCSSTPKQSGGTAAVPASDSDGVCGEGSCKQPKSNNSSCTLVQDSTAMKQGSTAMVQDSAGQCHGAGQCSGACGDMLAQQVVSMDQDGVDSSGLLAQQVPQDKGRGSVSTAEARAGWVVQQQEAACPLALAVPVAVPGAGNPATQRRQRAPPHPPPHTKSMRLTQQGFGAHPQPTRWEVVDLTEECPSASPPPAHHQVVDLMLDEMDS